MPILILMYEKKWQCLYNCVYLHNYTSQQVLYNVSVMNETMYQVGFVTVWILHVWNQYESSDLLERLSDFVVTSKSIQKCFWIRLHVKELSQKAAKEYGNSS